MTKSTRTKANLLLIIPITALIAFIITACGAPRGAGFTGANLGPQSANKRTQPGTVYTKGGGTQNITIDEGTNNISPQCQSAINQVHALSQACSAVLFANDDVVPSSCLNAFSNLNLVTCSNLNASVSNAKNACNATFQQFANELSANCRSAIQALGG